MIDLGSLQEIVNSFMETDVIIRHRSPTANDPSNRTGDDIVTFDTTTVAVKGWFVDPSTTRFTSAPGMSGVTDRPTIRLPVGTVIDSRDEVTINGDTWTVVDASSDETWPVMLKVSLVKVE